MCGGGGGCGPGPCGPFGICSPNGCSPGGCFPMGCPTGCGPCGPLNIGGSFRCQQPTKCCQPSFACCNPICPPPLTIPTRAYCSEFDGPCHARTLIRMPAITIHSQIPNRVCTSPYSSLVTSPGCCTMRAIGPPYQRSICGPAGNGGGITCCPPCGSPCGGGGGGVCGSSCMYDGRLDSSCCKPCC